MKDDHTPITPSSPRVGSAVIMAFPVDREVQFVRDTAHRLLHREGAARLKFWKTEKNRLYGRLQVRGLTASAIDAEIQRFAAAVHAEMQAIAAAPDDHANSPGGAA